MLRAVKGYRFGRSTKEKMAYEAISHAGKHAFAHRRDKKGDFRRLWAVRMNALLKAEGTSYSRLISSLKKANVGLDRKILSTLAQEHPDTFKKVLELVK